jgi:hypothetical protein
MKVTLLAVPPPPSPFQPFSIAIDIEDKDQLYALTLAAGRMCNGHGNELYALLQAKCDSIGMVVFTRGIA